MLLRKLSTIAALGLILSVFGSAALAGPCGDESDLDSAFCSGILVTVSPLATTLGVLDTSSATDDEREAYVQQIREDSAEFLATDGTEAPSAVLESAIQQIRSESAQAAQLNDRQIAEILVSAS